MTKLLVLATLALAVAASGGAAATPAHGRIAGIVPHASPSTLGLHALSRAAVGYAAPATLTFDAQYETLINRYFTDVAADSGKATNVYSVATQYYDDPGHVKIQYQSTFGDSYVSRDPLPTSGCHDGVNTYCLTDEQLQREIQSVLTAKGWHGAPDHVFFLMTPNGVGSCGDSFSTECSTNVFCAYHNFFVDSSSENVFYANEPYEGPLPPPDNCADSTQGFPNDVDSDTTINTISHEHNEAITDPLTDQSTLAWITDFFGDENGDLCAYGFGTQTGGTPGVEAYNQTINGHHYDLQQEYSNVGSGCVQKYPGGSPTVTYTHDINGDDGPLVYNGGPVMHTNTTYAIYWLPTAGSKSLPVVTGTAAVNQTVTSSAGAWTGSPTSYAYQWQTCSSSTTGCTNIAGATGPTYKLTSADGANYVRSTVTARNVNGASAYVASAGHLVVPLPRITRAPHISGRLRVGRRLSASKGTWMGTPATYRYQWLRCNAHGGRCSTIHHATHATYKLTRHDVKHRLRLRITATNAAGSGVAISAASARVGR